MIFKIIEATKFVRYVVETDNSVLEFFIVIKLMTLVTAASKDCIDNEDRESCKYKDRMLDQVNDQVYVKHCIRPFIVKSTNHKLFVPRLLLLSYIINGSAHDTCLDEPLDQGPGREALVAARLDEEAVAEEVVQCIKQDQPTCNAAFLCREAQIDEQVVVEEVPENQDHADAHEDYCNTIVLINVNLLGHLVDKEKGAAKEQAGPDEQENQLEVLYNVKQAKGSLTHFSFL